MTCEQFYNAAGTWLQVAGALLAAPDAVAHIFRSARAEIASATATAWRALPRPWKRHPPANVLSGSARLPMATGAGSGLASGAAHGATVQTFSLADPVPTNLQKLHDMIQRRRWPAYRHDVFAAWARASYRDLAASEVVDDSRHLCCAAPLRHRRRRPRQSSC